MKILLGSLLLFLTGSVSAADTLVMTVNSNQKNFLVTLPSNPTTGYQWSLIEYDKSFLKMTGGQYIAPQTKLIGAGGQMQFKFSLVPNKSYPASTTMVFKYLRPWEPEAGSIKKVIVNFKEIP